MKGEVFVWSDVATRILNYDGGLADMWKERVIGAGWDDYSLYLLTFWILLVFYLISIVPYTLLDLWKVEVTDKERLQPRTYNSTQKVFFGLGVVLLLFFAIVLPLQLSSFPFFTVAGINGTRKFPKLWESVLQIATFFVVEDYFNYWIHRWLHTPWAYRNIHYMHHHFETCTALAASYAHPLEILLLGIPSFLGPVLVGCHVTVCWAWFVLRQLEAIETHSGYDFWWSPTKLIPFYGGSEYHDYHHWVGGKSSGNFASVFTYCDWVYETDKGYRAERRRRNGGKIVHKPGKAQIHHTDSERHKKKST